MIIFESQKKAQQFICRIVPRGYWWWLSGIAINKTDLDARHAKYAEHYGCDLSPDKKSYRKRNGLANTHFIACQLPPEKMEGGFIWYLLVTDGAGSVRENLKLQDARINRGRTTWGDDYVLYEATRHRNEGGGVRWSWYMKPERQKELDYYVGQLLKTAPGELNAFFEAQCRRPMHHGIRQYITRLLKRAHQNFTRMYPGKPWQARDPNKPLPIISGYQ